MPAPKYTEVIEGICGDQMWGMLRRAFTDKSHILINDREFIIYRIDLPESQPPKYIATLWALDEPLRKS